MKNTRVTHCQLLLLMSLTKMDVILASRAAQIEFSLRGNDEKRNGRETENEGKVAIVRYKSVKS